MAYYKTEVIIRHTDKDGRKVRVEIDLDPRMVYGNSEDEAKRDALSEIAKLDLPAMLADRIGTEVEISTWYWRS